MERKSWRRTLDGRRSDESFLRCAAVVLPYLSHNDLASISSTCRTLNHITRYITYRRRCDSSRGIETLQIPFLNQISGDSQPYSYFLYSPTQILPLRSDFRQPWGSEVTTLEIVSRPRAFLFSVQDAFGCDCAECSGDSCPCSENAADFPSTECGPSCKCDARCANRLTQRGITYRLKIVKSERKGWGLYSSEAIPRGQFICEYAGELLSTEEARKREQNYDSLASTGRLTPALLVVKEHLPAANMCIRINIDATRIGNIARFINHSCDGGNLETAIVRSSGALLPRVCFFASRDIAEGEELSFSYGNLCLNPNGKPCFCGSSSCTGLLPSELT